MSAPPAIGELQLRCDAFAVTEHGTGWCEIQTLRPEGDIWRSAAKTCVELLEDLRLAESGLGFDHDHCRSFVGPHRGPYKSTN